MTIYVFDPVQGKVVEKGEETRVFKGPYVRGDLPAYRSPLGTGWVEGRAARREELKRHDCREVDPSEWRSFAEKAPKKNVEAERAYLAERAKQAPLPPGLRERLLRGR